MSCIALATKVNSQVRSMGVALTSCTPPAKGKPIFELGDDEMEVGVGIHGEPGRRRDKMKTADTIVDEIFDAVAERPAVQERRPRRADDQRPRRHAAERALRAVPQGGAALQRRRA